MGNQPPSTQLKIPTKSSESNSATADDPLPVHRKTPKIDSSVYSLPSKKNSQSLPKLKRLTRSFKTSPKTTASPDLTDRVRNNGVTDILIPFSIVQTVHLFLVKHLGALNESAKLEVACSIFFDMMNQDSDCNAFLRKQLKTKAKIQELSIMFLDMIEWITKMLLTNDIPLVRILRNLGYVHQSMGVGIMHFRAMLQALHSTFSHYFGKYYNISVRYAMDKLYGVSIEIMTGFKLLTNIDDGFISKFNITAASLDVCLRSNVGKQYLFTFLKQRYCDEFVVFLDSIAKYRAAMSCKQKFMIARGIVKDCIDPTAKYSVNIPSHARYELLQKMERFEASFHANENKEFLFPDNLFDACFAELRNLIMINHWARFVGNMESLRTQSVIVIV